MRRERVDLGMTDEERPFYLRVDQETSSRVNTDLAMLDGDGDYTKMDANPHLFVDVLFSDKPQDIERMVEQADTRALYSFISRRQGTS